MIDRFSNNNKVKSRVNNKEIYKVKMINNSMIKINLNKK